MCTQSDWSKNSELIYFKDTPVDAFNREESGKGNGGTTYEIISKSITSKEKVSQSESRNVYKYRVYKKATF